MQREHVASKWMSMQAAPSVCSTSGVQNTAHFSGQQPWPRLHMTSLAGDHPYGQLSCAHHVCLPEGGAGREERVDPDVSAGRVAAASTAYARPKVQPAQAMPLQLG